MSDLAAPSLPASARRPSLDVLRGATIAGMILVNNPGSWGHIYPPLRHAAWHGCTPTDLVFPFFLFMVGVSIPLALGRRLERGDAPRRALRKVLRRGALLFAFGLLLAWFPGTPLERLRVMGVLQRIAICYVAASALFLYGGPRLRAVVLVLALVLYWPLLALTPVPGLGAPDLDQQGAHLAGWLDRVVLGRHVWRGGVYDPEGLLSTIPALATALLGVFAGERLRRGDALLRQARDLAAAGALLAALGLAWGQVFPINKPLWTSSYAVFTGGLALVALALCIVLFDGAPGRLRRALARPFVVYGVNALLVFVGSGLVARAISRLWKLPDGRTLQQVVYEGLQRVPHVTEVRASLGYALLWIAGWYLVLEVLYRRRIFLKV